MALESCVDVCGGVCGGVWLNKEYFGWLLSFWTVSSYKMLIYWSSSHQFSELRLITDEFRLSRCDLWWWFRLDRGGCGGGVECGRSCSCSDGRDWPSLPAGSAVHPSVLSGSWKAGSQLLCEAEQTGPPCRIQVCVSFTTCWTGFNSLRQDSTLLSPLNTLI